MPRLYLVVRLWLYDDGDASAFEELEEEAARVMESYGGRIERTFRAKATADEEEPFEVHLVSFPDESAFAAYRDDERTQELKERREQIISRTQIWYGDEVNYGL